MKNVEGDCVLVPDANRVMVCSGDRVLVTDGLGVAKQPSGDKRSSRREAVKHSNVLADCEKDAPLKLSILPVKTHPTTLITPEFDDDAISRKLFEKTQNRISIGVPRV
jgi:hypothetical protein